MHNQQTGPNRVPSGWEIEALMVVKRMVRSLFSTSDVQLLWEPALGSYVIGVTYDYNIATRLPQVYFGIPVRQYAALPPAVDGGDGRWPSSSITYGPGRLSTDRGWGIGWPETMFSGGGVGMNNYSYCKPPTPMPARKSSWMPPPGGSSCDQGC